MKNLFIYTTSIGKIGIGDDGQAITHLYLPNQAETLDQPLNETALIKEAAIQLRVYLAGKLKQSFIVLVQWIFLDMGQQTFQEKSQLDPPQGESMR